MRASLPGMLDVKSMHKNHFLYPVLGFQEELHYNLQRREDPLMTKGQVGEDQILNPPLDEKCPIYIEKSSLLVKAGG